MHTRWVAVVVAAAASLAFVTLTLAAGGSAPGSHLGALRPAVADPVTPRTDTPPTAAARPAPAVASVTLPRARPLKPAPSAPSRTVAVARPAPSLRRSTVLSTPAPVEPAGPGYSFLFPLTGSGPLRWNPCRSIHYVTNLAAAPALRADLLAAMTQLSVATGIHFVFDGDTSERPTLARPVARGGDWAPVLVAVADSDLLAPGDVGEGRAQWWRSASGLSELVTGQVVLRPGSYPTRVGGFGDADAAGPMLLHELGHVVGLGHTAAIGAVMNHDGVHRGTHLSAGDLAGLQRLGRVAGCLPVLTAPTG